MCIPQWTRRRSGSFTEESCDTPLIASRRHVQRRLCCGLGNYLKTLFRGFTCAVNPRITFRKRNTEEDLQLEKSRSLAKEDVDKLRRGKLTRSKTTVTPNGTVVFRRTPTQRGKKTQYLLRSLTGI
eukprot:g7250.t1